MFIHIIKTITTMTKNTFSQKAAIAALILFNSLIFSAKAQAQFGGGDGSQNYPYIITTTDHLTELANNVNGGNTFRYNYFRLDADLDFTGKTYTIIADNESNGNAKFEGKFDGNDHTISGVTINRTSEVYGSAYVGLFGKICYEASIENLTLSNSTIKGRINVGGIVGGLFDFYSSNPNVRSVVRNCHVTSDVTIETVNMNSQISGSVGGIVGCMESERGSVLDCTSAATIIASRNSQQAGGIAGLAKGEGNIISGCVYMGSISGGTGYVGGILGYNIGNGATVTDNFVGGNCTIGAVGVEGSTQGTDEGYSVTHIYTIGFNSAQLTNGAIDTPPTKTIGGTNYYASGSTITLSNVSTFGHPGGGNMWTYRALVNNSNQSEAFPQEDGTWQFTMPLGNVLITPEAAIDITLTGYPYNTNVTFTPANATYNGLAHHPTVSVEARGNELVEGTQFFTDIPAAGFTYPGDHTVHVWGMDDYGGLRTETFSIAPASLTSFTIDPAMVYHDGEAHMPTLTVKSGSKTLNRGTEYETDLPNDGFSELGEHVIKVWGIGYYADTLTATFTIQHPWSGMGTMYTPFLIQNTDDMDLLASFVNGGKDYNGVYFRQAAHLDYTGKTYTPIGCYEEKPFQGTFEGSIYTITGIEASGYEYIGVFGNVGLNATLRSVTLVGDNSFTGMANGYCGSIAALNSGQVETCSVAEGANVTVSTAGSTAGGIVGKNSGGTINSCTNHAATVQANCAGGVVGSNADDGYVIGTNYATIEGYQIAGGICGVNNSGTITGQHFGTVLHGDICGGIVGDNKDVVEQSLSTDLMASVGDGENKGAIIGQNGPSGYASSNYYIGACKFGGINGSDLIWQAMRGWPIIADEIVNFNPDYSAGMVPGIYYNDEATNTNRYYVGAGEVIRFTLGSMEYVNTQYQANGTLLTAAGTNDYGETYYEMTMPAQDVNITIMGTITIELLDDDSQDFFDNGHRLSNSVGEVRNIFISGRTLYKDGRWNLICLPFALTSLTGTPLEGAEVRTLASTSTYANGILTLDFTDPLSATEAGKPYMVRWATGDNVTDPVFNNVTIDQNFLSIENTEGNIRFVGNLSNTTLDANTTEYLYFGDDGLLHYPYGTDYGLNALRGHFEITLENNVQVGTCNVNLGTPSTYAMLPAIFQTNGNWNEAAKWNIGTLPNEGADVLLLADAEVPSGYVVNAGSVIRGGYSGSLTIKDRGQLHHTNDDLYALLEKEVSAYTPNTKDGYHLIASPNTENVYPQQWNGFTDNEYDLYYYHEPTHYWINHKDQNDGDFYIEPLKGYLYANSQAVTLRFVSLLRPGNATVNVPLSYASTDGKLLGFNLLGNPFAHNVTSFTGSNVATEVYRMNGDGSDLMVSTISNADPLSPGEGFFVKATGDNASVNFNSRSTNAKTNHIALELSENGKLVDRLILKNEGNPLEKFNLSQHGTRIYATEDGQDYAVVILDCTDVAPNVSTNELPVNFKAAKNGSYTISVNLGNMDLDYLHLIDNLTGADVDLLDTNGGYASTYTFSAKSNDYVSRFRLVFSNFEDAIGDNGDDSPFAYISNGEIRLMVETCHGATLQIMDMMGRVVHSTDVRHHVSTNGIPTGVFVLRLIEGNDVKTQKIVIQ